MASKKNNDKRLCIFIPNGKEEKEYTEYIREKYDILISRLPIGKENAIKVRTLAPLCNYANERNVQYLLRDARDEGLIICSDTMGVYLPKNVKEIKEFYSLYKGRSLDTLKMLKTCRLYLKGIENNDSK